MAKHYKMHCEGIKVGASFGNTQPPPPVELSILLHWDGRIQITGPLNDKEFCLRMLDSAKEQIINSDVKQLVSSN